MQINLEFQKCLKLIDNRLFNTENASKLKKPVIGKLVWMSKFDMQISFKLLIN